MLTRTLARPVRLLTVPPRDPKAPRTAVFRTGQLNTVERALTRLVWARWDETSR